MLGRDSERIPPDELGFVKVLLKGKWKLTESARKFLTGSAQWSPKRSLREVCKQVESQLRTYLVKFYLPTFSSSLTMPAAADACISALLSLAVVKSRGPFRAGGTDCLTLRSTIGRNGASFWAKHG